MSEKGKKILETMDPVDFKTALEQVFNLKKNSRCVKLYTGPGGYNMFEEAMENECGWTRIYMSKKPPRFMKMKVRKSITGRYYKLLRLK
jgi:predicted DNA-binding protein (UPF0278 family)